MATFIKPSFKFFLAGAPAIGIYIQSDYNNARTREELFGLVHKWMNVAEATKNEVKKHWYMVAAKNLYSTLTNRSYDSK